MYSLQVFLQWLLLPLIHRLHSEDFSVLFSIYLYASVTRIQFTCNWISWILEFIDLASKNMRCRWRMNEPHTPWLHYPGTGEPVALSLWTRLDILSNKDEMSTKNEWATHSIHLELECLTPGDFGPGVTFLFCFPGVDRLLRFVVTFVFPTPHLLFKFLH